MHYEKTGATFFAKELSWHLPAEGILAFLLLCHKDCNIPVYPKYYLPSSIHTTFWMIFSSKDKMRHKVSHNIFGGRSWTAPCTTVFNKFLFLTLATTKLKSEEKKISVTLKNLIPNSAMKLR